MKVVGRRVLLVLLLMSLGACSSGGGGDGSSGGATTPTLSEEVPDTLLEGIWESACLPAPAPAVSRRYTVSITGEAIRFGDTTFGGAACAEESALRDIDTLATFSEQLPADGQSIEDGIPIDLAVDQVTATPRLLQVAMLYNQEGICSAVASEWVPGVSQDVSGCNDETGTLGVETSAPRTDYNLFLVDDAGTPENTAAMRPDDRLLFGTLGAQPNEAQRPRMVSQEIVFRRRAAAP